MISKKILYHLLKNSDNFGNIVDKKITENYFLDEPSQILFKILFEFFRKYSSRPTADEIDIIVNKSKYSADLKPIIITLYHEVKSLKDDSDFNFLLDSLTEEYKLRISKDSVLSCVKYLELNDADAVEGALKKCLSSINDIGNNKFREELTVTSDERYRRYEDSKIPDRRHYIPTGFPTLDKVTGGIQPGELWVIEGWAKAGKSLFLLNIAYNVWKLGKSVLYVSAELAKEQIARRFDSLANFLPYNNLKFGALTDDEDKKYQKFLKDMKEKSNKFDVVFEPGCSTLSIYQEIKNIQLKHPLDLIIVDYLGICVPAKKYSSLAESIGNVALELRNMAGAEKIPIITAHQRNRAGQLSGKLGLEYTSDSIKIPQHCDLYAAIKVKDEKEKELSYKYDLEFRTLASRDSSICNFTCECYADRMLVREKTFG